MTVHKKLTLQDDLQTSKKDNYLYQEKATLREEANALKDDVGKSIKIAGYSIGVTALLPAVCYMVNDIMSEYTSAQIPAALEYTLMGGSACVMLGAVYKGIKQHLSRNEVVAQMQEVSSMIGKPAFNLGEDAGEKPQPPATKKGRRNSLKLNA